MRKAIILSLFFISAIQCRAQWGQVCVDSGRIQPYFSCNRPEFTPVCGCNLVTYRNDCVAFNQYGVNNWTDGVCLNDLIFFDMWPDIVRDQSTFYLKSASRTSATIEIIDAFGKIMYYRNMNVVPEPYYFETFYLSGYRPGIYFVVIRTGKKMLVRRLIKT